MRKRYTDREKFNDNWYRKLSLKHKVLWEYLITECNHAGIFEKFDPELASFKIGAEITLEDIKFFGARVKILSNSILFIPGFIKFHYEDVNQLNPKNRLHKSVLTELKKYNLLEFLGATKDLLRSLEGPININISIPIKEDREDNQQVESTSLSFGPFLSLDEGETPENIEFEADKTRETQAECNTAPETLFKPIVEKLEKTYPRGFKNPEERQKYKPLGEYCVQNYDLDALYNLILRENPYKDFAPSLQFILERLPRVRVFPKPPARAPEPVSEVQAAKEHEKGAIIARRLVEKYGHKKQTHEMEYKQ